MAVDGVGGATRMQAVHDTDRTTFRMATGDRQADVAARRGISAEMFRDQTRAGRAPIDARASVARNDKSNEADDGPPANVDRDPRWLSPKRLRDQLGREFDATL